MTASNIIGYIFKIEVTDTIHCQKLNDNSLSNLKSSYRHKRGLKSVPK